MYIYALSILRGGRTKTPTKSFSNKFIQKNIFIQSFLNFFFLINFIYFNIGLFDKKVFLKGYLLPNESFKYIYFF